MSTEKDIRNEMAESEWTEERMLAALESWARRNRRVFDVNPAAMAERTLFDCLFAFSSWRESNTPSGKEKLFSINLWEAEEASHPAGLDEIPGFGDIDAGTITSGELSTTSWCLSADGTLVFMPAEGDLGILELPEDGNWPWQNIVFWENVRRIVTSGTIAVRGSLEDAFRGMDKLVDIEGLADWDVSGVTSLSYTFCGCRTLEGILPLAGWDTGRVMTLHGTFCNCTSLRSLDGLDNWDTSGVISLAHTLTGCEKIVSLDSLVNWDVSRVASLYSTFYGCEALESVDGLAKWDVGSVIVMECTFSGCSLLADLNALAGWDVSSAKSLDWMFEKCGSLTSLSGLEGWDVGSVTSMFETFAYCTSLADISALESWDLGKLEPSNNSVFCCCGALGEIPAWARE